ncbi:MAG TPA: class I SAM-dependent methyltransferase [Phycisphaerae bacterium]|nr:class I SAM-dependent methyltransferase [Phycisphaerae bacterium]
MVSLAVCVDSDRTSRRSAAHALAERFGVPAAALDSPGFEAFLVVTDDRLELRAANAPGMGPVYVDFLTGAMRRRQREPGSAGQMIARAVGYKGQPLRIVDATAGLGRDAFLLAGLGCTVTAVERSPIVAALLADGLRRAADDPEVGPILRDRLLLVEADARAFLESLSETNRPDVVYIDPMFPHRTKSALVKKEMRLCRLAAGDDPDADELFRVALTVARSRVVVKRRLRAPVLVREPAFSYKGRAVRFDVYPCR